MPDYSQGKIYRLVGGGLTYIGSTSLSLSTRKYRHKRNWKDIKAGKKRSNVASFELFETGEPVEIFLIEDFPCERREQLRARERYWMEQYMGDDSCVNKRLPCSATLKDGVQAYHKDYYKQNNEKVRERRMKYYESNKKKEAEYMKQYAEKNKEKIREYKRRYAENNKEKIAEYMRNNKEKNAEYKRKNKEKIAEYNRRYAEKNKEKIAEQRKQRTPCPECGKEMRKSCIPRHIRRVHTSIENVN